MGRAPVVRAAIALSLLCGGAAAKADILDFSGSLTAFGSAGPDASCAPLPFRAIVSTTDGSSPLGDFSYSHNICLSGFSGPSEGTFVFDFGADSFEGALTGMATPSATPGLVDLIFNYTITGGTGRFLDATGTFTGTGTSDVRMGPPPLISLAFDGNINAPAVPEPGTWGTMLLGFGIAGWAIRRRRRTAQLSLA